MRACFCIRLATLTLVAAAISSLASAQAPGLPPRDQQRPAAQTGTAAIRGRVFAGDTGKPLRRARITVNSPELAGNPRNTSTDSDGRYEVTDLPAGRYGLRVSRSGYLELRYGQRRPLEPAKQIQLLDRQVVERIDFSLPRMGLITGRILDEFGDPIEGVNVYALRSMYFNGRRQLVPTGGGPQVRTDDAGQYRLLGLAPGTYFISASTRETWTVARGDVKETMGYAPTYLPGTTRVGDARRVAVKLGQEASNADFSLVVGRAAKISGTAFDSHGKPYTSVSVNQEVRGDGFASFGSAARGNVAADGTFSIPGVPPGDYILAASSGRDSSEPDVALVPITVDSIDLDNISLTGSTGGTVTGQVVTDEGTVPDIPRLRITLLEYSTGQPSPTVLGAFRNPGASDVKADGTFSVTGVFGQSRLRVTLPDAWAVKAAMLDGRDVAEQPFDLRSGETINGMQIIVTNKVTSVIGQIVDDKGAPVMDGTVIVFASDSNHWAEDSRYVKSSRPDQHGQWTIKGLPAGEYLAVAVDYVEDGQWNEAEYLESLRHHAQKLTLDDAASVSISLKLTAPDQR